MHRWMTRFAVGAKCGRSGRPPKASEPTGAAPRSARSNVASAAKPMPVPLARKNERRDMIRA